MDKAMLLKMYDYDDWANQRLLDCAERVTPEQWAAPHDYSQGGLHATLYHILVVKHGWHYACRHGQRWQDRPGIEQFPTAAALRPWAAEHHATIRAYIEGLSEADLKASLALKNRDGQEHSFVLWRILIHVLYHGAQHRSEAAQLLTHYGQSPGDLDFIFFE